VSHYDFGPGDVIHIDAGSYTIARDVLLGLDSSGVRIEGYHDPRFPDRHALLHRGNQSAGSAIFELDGASGVTLSNLRLTGADTGVFASDDSVVQGFLLTDSELFANASAGIRLGAQIRDARIENNRFFGSALDAARQFTGIESHGPGAAIVDNHIFDHAGSAIIVSGASSVVERNDVHGNAIGILAEPSEGAIVASGNRVHDNSDIGIEASGSVCVSGNQVFGHLRAPSIGVSLMHGAEAVENHIYRNTTGLSAGANPGDASSIRRNFIFGNTGAGLILHSQTVALGNKIYSNQIGIESGPQFHGLIAGNVIYANLNFGIRIAGTADDSPARIVNNTILQAVGTAVSFGAGTGAVQLYNNILRIESGPVLQFEGAGLDFLESDYNLFHPVNAAAQARIADTPESSLNALAAWQQLSRNDLHSLAGEPGFVDEDGADNLVGFNSANGGIDSGADDNFTLEQRSPAIDRGHSWAGMALDALGVARSDDAGTANLGSPEYVLRELGEAARTETGRRLDDALDNGVWLVRLDFAFPFYGEDYSAIRISPAGFILPGSATPAPLGRTISDLAGARMIAALWAEIGLVRDSDAVFVDESVSGQITIRWEVGRATDGSPVSFSITLNASGAIRFHYAAGAAGLDSIRGISSGDGEHFAAPGALAMAGNGRGFEFATSTTAGVVDIGALEFTGASNDLIAPRVTNISPDSITRSQLAGEGLGEIRISFSEPVNAVDANASGNFELRREGGDGLFGNADDSVLVLAPSYTPGALEMALVLDPVELVPGKYQLRVSGQTSLHDAAGNRLDGDADGAAGGDYVREFIVTGAVPDVREVRTNPGANQLSRVTSITVQFNLNVAASLAVSDFALRRLDAGGILEPLSMAYDSARHEATLQFPGSPGGALLEGRYELSVLARGVATSEGIAMVRDHVADFTVLAGDTNGDAVTNDLDLYNVWQNLLRPAADRDLSHDLNGDGQIDARDLEVVGANIESSIDEENTRHLIP
jgi:hypothetical protein